MILENNNEALSMYNLMEEIYYFIALYFAKNRLVEGCPAK